MDQRRDAIDGALDTRTDERDAGNRARSTMPSASAAPSSEGVTLTISGPRIDAPPWDDETAREVDVRTRIEVDRQRGLVAIDAGYALVGHVLHEPLSGDEAAAAAATPPTADALVLQRSNRTQLVVRYDELRRLSDQESDVSGIHSVALVVAEHLGGDETRELMRRLYVLANDAGRTGRFTIRMTRLLDLCGYKKDARGVHRSANRLWVSQALLALHYTHVGITVTGVDGRRKGSIGNLLSALEYDAPPEAADLSPMEIFHRGLPDLVRVTINPVWYRLRDDAGRHIDNPLLVPRASLLPAARKQGHGGNRRSAATTLSEYLLAVRPNLGDRLALPLYRHEALARAGITDRSRYNATKTLTKALDRLVHDAVIASYEPSIVPADDDDPITLTFHPVTHHLFDDLDDPQGPD